MKFKKRCGFGEERERLTDIEVNVEIGTDFAEVVKTDEPDRGIDFDRAYKMIALAMQEEAYTIERMAYKIWNKLKEIKNSGIVRVEVKKTNPPVNGDIDYTGVIIEE